MDGGAVELPANPPAVSETAVPTASVTVALPVLPVLAAAVVAVQRMRSGVSLRAGID